MPADNRAQFGSAGVGIDEDDDYAGSQAGGNGGVGQRVDEQQCCQHCHRGQGCLEEIEAGVCREFGVQPITAAIQL